MTSRDKQTPHARRGSVAALVAVSLTALLGVSAIVLDGGTLMNKRRHAQVTADAAALAGASDLFKLHRLYLGKDAQGSAKQAALDVAKDNGYNNDNSTNTVTVNIPPASGNFVGQDGYVEVIVHYNQKRGFSGLFGSGDMPVRGRAVARATSSVLKKGLILLSPSATDSLQISGNGKFTVNDGSIIVNSKSNIAFQSSGNGTIAANSIEVSGYYQKSGGAQILAPINTAVKPTPDPLSALPEPKPSDHPIRATQQTTVSTSSGGDDDDDDGGGTTLYPGVYRGGINFSGNGKLTLKAGIYIMEGGGFQHSGQGYLYGEEVVIFNMVAADGNHGQILISGQGRTELTAPTSGVYQGISIFQQRTQTDVVQISGNGDDNIGGVVYAKSAKTYLSGTGTTSVDTLGGSFVCDTMQISGDGEFMVNLGGNVPPGMREFGLVE